MVFGQKIQTGLVLAALGFIAHPAYALDDQTKLADFVKLGVECSFDKDTKPTQYQGGFLTHCRVYDSFKKDEKMTIDEVNKCGLYQSGKRLPEYNSPREMPIHTEVHLRTSSGDIACQFRVSEGKDALTYGALRSQMDKSFSCEIKSEASNVAPSDPKSSDKKAKELPPESGGSKDNKKPDSKSESAKEKK